MREIMLQYYIFNIDVVLYVTVMPVIWYPYGRMFKFVLMRETVTVLYL